MPGSLDKLEEVQKLTNFIVLKARSTLKTPDCDFAFKPGGTSVHADVDDAALMSGRRVVYSGVE